MGHRGTMGWDRDQISRFSYTYVIPGLRHRHHVLILPGSCDYWAISSPRNDASHYLDKININVEPLLAAFFQRGQ